MAADQHVNIRTSGSAHMVVGTFRFGDAAALGRSRTGKRPMAAIACAALLAACQNFPKLPDFASEPRQTCIPGDAPAQQRSAAARARAEEPYAIVVLDRPDVRRVQARLAKLGYAPGPVDGIVGRQTRNAIRRFQSANCMAPTGVFSSRFLAYLGVSAASARPPSKPEPQAPTKAEPRASAKTHARAPAKAEPRAPVNLTAKDFPTYRRGMTFVYANGDVDRVAKAKDGTVKWVRSNGVTYTTDRNFLLPRLSWTTDDERGSATVSGVASRLWPLRKGAEVAFSAKVAVQRRDDPHSTERRVERWRCRNEGGRRVAVPAGAFDTVAFVCRRTTDPASPDIVRTWYYAKEVRHFVRFIEIDPRRNATRSVDLVAISPGMGGWPPIARAALARAIVQTLEAPEKEARAHWKSSGVNARVTIDAGSPSVGAEGRPCRQLVQTWAENGHSRPYPALACQTVSGTWEIPGLENDAAGRWTNPDEASLR